MTVIYAAAFDLNTIRGATDATDYAFGVTLASAGKGDIVIAPSDFEALSSNGSAITLHHDKSWQSVNNHEGADMFAELASYTMQSALQSIITAKMATAVPSWSGTFTVTYDATGTFPVYTLAHDSLSFSITFANLASARLLGYSNTVNGASLSRAGTICPHYVCVGLQGGRSNDAEGDFEPDSIASLSISDTATTFAGISRSTAPKYRRWVQQFETKERVFKAFGVGSIQWTWEKLFEHCRCDYPFLVDDGEDEMACIFLPEGSSFRGKVRAGGPTDDVHFHIPFAVWHAGNFPTGG